MPNSALLAMALELTDTALSEDATQQRSRAAKSCFDKVFIGIKVLAFLSCAKFICFTSFGRELQLFE